MAGGYRKEDVWLSLLLGEPKTLCISCYSDVVASVSFYTDLFGFTETFRTPKSGTPIHVELRLGHQILGLASIESPRLIHGLAVGEGSREKLACADCHGPPIVLAISYHAMK